LNFGVSSYPSMARQLRAEYEGTLALDYSYFGRHWTRISTNMERNGENREHQNKGSAPRYSRFRLAYLGVIGLLTLSITTTEKLAVTTFPLPHQGMNLATDSAAVLIKLGVLLPRSREHLGNESQTHSHG
jgi:hypothetical protein